MHGKLIVKSVNSVGGSLNDEVMKWKVILFGLVVFFLAVQCSTTNDLGEAHDRIRQLQPDNIVSYHQPVQMEVAWVPYTEHRLEWTKKNEWRVVKDPAVDTTSTLPMILLSYPGGTDSIWLDMNMDDATFGRLLKHTMMTQIPISRPFTEYIEIAKCENCHPENVKLPENLSLGYSDSSGDTR